MAPPTCGWQMVFEEDGIGSYPFKLPPIPQAKRADILPGFRHATASVDGLFGLTIDVMNAFLL
ncbi:hypothetical protein [Sinorhizobium medicae]|uniref:hypothetical protein n=1 Tax=Sinorhizobium medicae TaxID=110321 RepID=UPI0011A01A13|nr:hypothetical protein [Sinorhizobium medicae]